MPSEVSACSTCSRSIARKCDSPCSAKMSAIGPCSATIILSVSANGSPRARATRLPILVLPAPGGPMITSTGPERSDSTEIGGRARAERLRNGREVGVEVAPGLAHRIAPELLEHRVREYERDHGLRHHTGSRNGADVRALVVRGCGFAGRDVDGA